MHDLDRTLLELEAANGAASLHGEYENYESAAPASELEQEAADQFLELESEAEMEAFMGELIKRAATTASGVVNNPQVRRIAASVAKSAVRAALPAAGESLAKGIWGKSGSTLGRKAGEGIANLMGLAKDGGRSGARELVRTLLEILPELQNLATRGVPAAEIERILRTRLPALSLTIGATGAPPVRQATTGTWSRVNGKIVLHGI